MKRSNQELGPDRYVYEIKVRGQLDEHWSDWFDGMAIEVETSRDGSTLTTLTVVVADQPQLRGILSTIWDLNLTVISATPKTVEQG